MVWEEALTGLDMVIVLDRDLPEVAAAARSTREILERLKARPYLERLDAVLAADATPASASRRRLTSPVAADAV